MNNLLESNKINNQISSLATVNTLVIIDPNVTSPQQLAAGIIPGAAVKILDADGDGIIQITEILRDYPNINSLHLVSHGSPGCIHLGDSKLNLATLPLYSAKIASWFSSANPQLSFYTCNLAAAPELLTQLHSLTGASIAASAQEVGQGNWNLEWQIGEISSDSAFTTELQQQYLGTFPFDPQVTFAVGTAPQGVAIGDFDGDGDSDDIVVGNDYGNGISVLLADGSGGFTSTTFPGSGSDLAVGDFNEDGTDDFAIVDFNDLSVFLSDGSGGFTGPTNFTAGAGPVSVAVGDFNNDDNLDLAVSNQNTPALVSTFLGDGSGGFTASTTVSVGSQATFVEVGDLDGDGEVDDLVVARRLAGSVSVFLESVFEKS